MPFLGHPCYLEGGAKPYKYMVLRNALLYLSRQTWLRHWVETSSVTKGLTGRFVAGHTLDHALAACRKLQQQHIAVTLDYLGENVKTLDEAKASRDHYIRALDQIDKGSLPATVSIKLTQFGLDLSQTAACQNVRDLVQRACGMQSRVEIDMESSEYTDRTLDIVREMHDRFGCVRAVIQAYLHRSEGDIHDLNRRGIPVRLCKGAYQEPPSVAFASKADVDRNYEKLATLLLREGNYPAIASHDERMIRHALSVVTEHQIEPGRFEFQMLYGIRRDLQEKLVAQGYRMRAYVPFGDAWYPYFMRRLAERPANLLFLAKSLVKP